MRKKRRLYPVEMTTQSLGKLTTNVTTDVGYKPIENAKITVKLTGPENNFEEVITTDQNGQSEPIELPTPPKDYSLEPNSPKPYNEYTLNVESEGYEPVTIAGCQVLPDTLAIQDAGLKPKIGVSTTQDTIIIISPHTLYEMYPPKIPEEPVKEDFEDGYIVLDKAVVPEIIVVHDGAPDDKNAKNYFVRFTDYIKNVASSEIYSTWPESTIQANILAILSFTLNRVFTEWYRNKGYSFTITSSTAYDQKFIYGRNYYKNISENVDALFTNYLSKPGIKQPILSQYCDGVRVSCPEWLSQWGSKYLGDQGTSTINILRNYYGPDIYINTAEKVSGIPSSFPGYNLELGSRGTPVRTIQQQLNAISDNYPAIPRVRVDGVFGVDTKDAVETFQEVFYLPVNGIVDYPTWYKISDIFVAVTRMAELP
jgi:peptidoglycan hydrolase-like protein with peptidoglycan-binding domain